MDESHFLLKPLAYLGAAIVFVPLFRRSGLGAVLGYLAAGVSLGPSGFALVENPTDVLHFAEVGVIMLLFVIGLELEPAKLWQLRRNIVFTGLSQLLISGALLGLLLMLLGLAWGLALLLGFVLALSSTAFALQLMEERKILGSQLGRRGFSILLLQDIAVIPLVLVVGATAKSTAALEHQPNTLVGVAAVVGLLLAGRFLLKPLLKLIAAYASREIMAATALFIVLGYAGVMQMVGLSAGLGAFMAGIVLATSDYRHQLEADINSFKGLLLGLFFMAIGMTLDLSLLAQQPVLILGFALALMAVKTAVIAVALKVRGATLREGLTMGLLLSQGGEFAFVLLTQMVTGDHLSQETASLVTLVVGMSMALTAPLLVLFERLSGGKDGAMAVADDGTGMEREPEVIIAGFGRYGQIVGRILQAGNIPFTALDKDPRQIEFVKRFGNQVSFGDASQLELLYAAGIAHARVFVVAIDDPDTTLHIVELCREHFPKLQVLARARNRVNALQLRGAGCTQVVRETWHSSLNTATSTLVALGYSEGAAMRRAQLFANHDEGVLEQAVGKEEDMEALIEIGKRGRAELEQLFEQDQSI
ncbi:MAG: monovalent cation:proton antiporter-2 (CPA2) family protein [Pseudomonadota bacterium]